MSGYSVKRNEILHLDNYNERTMGDDTIPMIQQIFLDLVGDGTENYKNHGFKDVSPFITKIEIDHDVLTTAIIENFIKVYYKWGDAVNCVERIADSIKYATPKIFDNLGEPHNDYRILTRDECTSLTWNTYNPEELPIPSELYRRWAKKVDGFWQDISKDDDPDYTDPDGVWIMPIKRTHITTDNVWDLICDEGEFKKEIDKIIRLLSNSDRNNTISTNVETPKIGKIHQYKYTEDVVTGRKYHSFWVLTDKDTPLFQKETDKCINMTTGEEVVMSQTNCDAGDDTEWKVGNVIPQPHKMIIDFEDGLEANMGSAYNVTLQKIGTDPITNADYNPDQFVVYNKDYINPDNPNDIKTLKKNLYMELMGSALSATFNVTYDQDSDVLEIGDTIDGRPFTFTMTDDGSPATGDFNIWNTGASFVKYSVDSSGYTSLSTSSNIAPTFQLGNTYSYTLQIPIETSYSPAIEEEILFEWEYTVYDNDVTANDILNDLSSAINESEKFVIKDVITATGVRDYTILKTMVVGNKLIYTFPNEGTRKLYMHSGKIYISNTASIDFHGHVLNNNFGTLLATIFLDKSSRAKVDPDILFKCTNQITQFAEEGTNTNISLNFHLWKDLQVSNEYIHIISTLNKSEDANWFDQPKHSIDTPFSRIEEIKDHSMGPLVLETIESDANWNLSGKIVENTKIEKPQKWRIRFDVNRGVEMVDQSSTLSSMPEELINFEYLEVNVATEYQLLSNGDVTKLEGRDGFKESYIKSPGYLGYIRDQYVGYDFDGYYSAIGNMDQRLDEQNYTTEKLRLQKGFFRRSSKIETENSYPMSYRLTVAKHGMIFHVADDASIDQSDDYAWFVVQRHVNTIDGTPYLETTAPVHCLYMTSEPPVYVSDLDPYYVNAGDTTRLEQIYAADGLELNPNVSIPKSFELGYPDFTKEGRFRRFVVREKNVLKPWDVHKLASINTVDSAAIIHVGEQLSITDKNKIVINFPNRLCSQKFMFANSELDLIAYCSAGTIAETTYMETERYGDYRVYEALKASEPYGNGMRILALVQGDIIDESDIADDIVSSTAAG